MEGMLINDLTAYFGHFTNSLGCQRLYDGWAGATKSQM